MLIIFILLMILFTSNAFAYADPGSGAFIIQAIIALFGAIVLYLCYPIIFIKKILKIIKNKLFKGSSEKNEKGKNT